MGMALVLFAGLATTVFASNAGGSVIVTGTGNTTMVINSSVHFNKPLNYLDTANLTSMGESLAPSIMQTARFKQLANGVAYNIDKYRSFGYTWGANIPSTERIVLFAPNNASHIVVDIYVSNDTIQDMYYVPKSNVSYTINSNNWGGYGAQYYSSNIVSQAYGNVVVPSTISAPSGATHACCEFAEWTGVTFAEGSGNFVQGGIAYAGFNQVISNANSNGFALFVESPPSAATYISAPSWMNGVKGQTITLYTNSNGNCATGGLIWLQEWKDGSSSTSQSMGCSGGNDYYGWYIFESPNGCTGSGCFNFTSGGQKYSLFQLPDFSSVGFTGNICGAAFTCRNINSNSDPIYQLDIYHNSQDTSTSTISSGGNSWTESWVSSN